MFFGDIIHQYVDLRLQLSAGPEVEKKSQKSTLGVKGSKLKKAAKHKKNEWLVISPKNN